MVGIAKGKHPPACFAHCNEALVFGVVDECLQAKCRASGAKFKKASIRSVFSHVFPILRKALSSMT
eukprot:5200028-Prorocentrum_lima.AAC.1